MNVAKPGFIVAAVLALSAVGIAVSAAQERVTVTPPPGSAYSELISGYYFLTEGAQALQDDDTLNPGFLWVETGAESWTMVEGKAGKACTSCHGDAEDTMKGVGATYPKVHEGSGKLISLEQRINLCRTENMQAEAWPWETDELLAMTVYVRHQSRGMPVRVSIDGPARNFFDKGEAFFYRRRGLLDMNCAQCHEVNTGKHLRANWLSQGHTNAFPAYRFPWERLVSVHDMLKACNKRLRSTPFDYGSDEYLDLELYLAWRGNGLSIESPGIRP